MDKSWIRPGDGCTWIGVDRLIVGPGTGELQFRSMTFDVDEPLSFSSAKCGLCGREDTQWFLMQLLADGDWRKIVSEGSLRQQGLDEIDVRTRVYFVHECTEKIMRMMWTEREVHAFQMALRERIEK